MGINFILPCRQRPTSLDKRIRALGKLFADLDRDIARFNRHAQLRCPRGCGQCCEGPTVETTILELLPVAAELFKNGRAEFWLKQSEEADGKGRCVFYRTDAALPGESLSLGAAPAGGQATPLPEESLASGTGVSAGRCSIYPFRPLICRLFGFSTRIAQDGLRELVTCPAIKQACPDALLIAQRYIASRKKAPAMNDYVRRLFTIDPTLGVTQLPINAAIAEAILKVGVVQKSAGLEAASREPK